ncbi:MAG TPA: DUF4332 domain-containing protein, partial [Candidatus Thermoplasmatota archaeon]|nr:DUF4332 domain-containing protein [Candidatus Thermoplasmatota archaeon]
MELKRIKGIGPSKQEKLKAAGITSVEELARADVLETAETTGLSVETVRELKQRAAAYAVVEDIKGLGPSSVETFAERALEALQEATDGASKRLREDLEQARVKVQEWVKQAEATARRVAEESKTPEGRKALVAEGRQVAEQTAEKARETAQKAIDFAKKESEVVLARAKEFQSRAP